MGRSYRYLQYINQLRVTLLQLCILTLELHHRYIPVMKFLNVQKFSTSATDENLVSREGTTGHVLEYSYASHKKNGQFQ